MKVFSNTFREALREDRQLNAVVSFRTSQAFNVLTTQDDKNLMTENSDFLVTEKVFLNYDKESINSINPLFNTSLFKTTCKSVQIDSINKIEKGTWINIKIGVYKVDTKDYEYLDFGNYYVNEEPVYQADTNSYLTTAYDKMVESMVSYDDNPLSVKFPISIRNFIVAICEKFDWNYDFSENFPNYARNVPENIYEGQGLTYRDVLDDLNGVCGGSFMFDIKNKLVYKDLTETKEIVEDNDLKDVNVNFGEKYGKVNALTITTNGNVVIYNREDSKSIEQNGKVEFNINDNYLLNYDAEYYADEIFSIVNGLEYYLYDVDSTGLLIFDPLDVFTFRHDGIDYKTIMLNDDIKLTQGLVETTYVEKPKENKSDYKVTDMDKNKLNNAIISLNKANSEIVLKVDSNGKLAQARLDGNADKGSTFEVKADNIKLEGYTTVGDKISFNLDGSITAQDLRLGNGGKVIGGDGMMSVMMISGCVWSNQFTGGSGFMPLGFEAYNGSGIVINNMLDFVIPSNFKPQKAFIYLRHVPLISKGYFSGGMNLETYTGYARNVNAYICTDGSFSRTISYSGDLAEVSGNYQKISNCFGVNGFTGSTYGVTQANSIDITNYIKNAGTYSIKIKSDYATPSGYKNIYEATGSVLVQLYIYGYTSEKI